MRKSILIGLVLVFSVTLCSADVATSPNSMTLEAHPVSLLSDYVVHAPIVIASDSDFETQAWPGNGTSEDPYVINGLQIAEDGWHAIDIQDTGASFIVSNCSLNATTGVHGIAFNNVSNAIIQSNVFNDISDNAMRIWFSENITIRNNTCIGQRGGIDTLWCNNFVIENNTISTAVQAALHLQEISNVTVFDNYLKGGLIDRGLDLEDVDKCNITENEISYVNVYLDVSNTTFSFNKIHSGHFTIHASSLAVFDYNYYTTYDGDDLDGDHIGDDPFDYESVYDSHPLMFWPWFPPDLTPPTIDSPVDIEYGEFDSGYSITWQPADANPHSYFIYRNDTLVKSGTWNSSSETINVTVDGLSRGVYNYTIAVVDNNDNTNTDQVVVRVIDLSAPTTDHPQDIQYDEFTTGHSITWDPDDQNPLDYSISRDGTLARSGLWNSTSENISINVDGLAIGAYLFNITIRDLDGNTANDSVWVTVSDATNPTIDSPGDIFYNEGQTGYLIEWNPGDQNPLNYTITRNGTFVKSGFWNSTSENISISVDGLGFGSHEFVITVEDVGGNPVSDTVWVTVDDATSPTIDSPGDVFYNEGETGNTIVWTPSDLNPAGYTLYKNGTVAETGKWNGSILVIEVGGLNASAYNFTMLVWDAGNNTASDIVYVFSRDLEVPTIDSPLNVIYEGGTTNHSIIWTPLDNRPYIYRIFLNGTLYDTGSWNGSVISLSIDGLLPGVHNLSLQVIDVSWNAVADTVFVTVVDTITPLVGNPEDLVIEYSDSGEIFWTCSDLFPATSTILLNGVELVHSVWDGSSINHSIVTSSLGSFNYTLILIDMGGNTVIDTVIVTIADNTLPTINSPNDIEFIEGQTPPAIEWTPNDLMPLSWEIMRNATLIDSGLWNGSEISIPILGLTRGTYNYTLLVQDGGGNVVSDTVFVIVIPNLSSPGISSPNDASWIEGTQGSVITWTVSDNDPSHYQILLNDVELESGSWSGMDVSVETGMLQPGVYNYTLKVWDIYGNHAQDSVIISVELDVERMLFIGAAASGGIGAVFLVILGSITITRRKKRKNALRTIMMNRKRVPVRDIADEIGLPIENTISLISREGFVSLSNDQSDCINLEMLRTDLEVTFNDAAKVESESVLSEWSIEYETLHDVVMSLPFSIIETNAGNFLVKEQFIDEMLRQLDEQGVLSFESNTQKIGISRQVSSKEIEKRLQRSQLRIEGTSLFVSMPWLETFKQNVQTKGVIELREFAKSLGISKRELEVLLTNFVTGTFDNQRESFVVGATKPVVVTTSPKKHPNVVALRGGEFVGNKLRYKVKVLNESRHVVTDVTVSILSYPRDSLRLDSDSTKSIMKLEPGGFRSPTFDFLPTQDCVKGDVIASVSYVDSEGKPHSITTETYTIRAVCDLLQSETISADRFELRLKEMDCGEITLKVEEWTPEEMHSKTLQILESSNFFEVSSDMNQVGNHVESRITGWAKGKYTGKNVGVEITITGKPGVRKATCRIKMSGEDEAMIMPAIDEIKQKLSAWLCPMCGGVLPQKSVDRLKVGNSVACSFCGVTIDR